MISGTVKKALYFAAQKHHGQFRKGGSVPFIVHPFLVGYCVSEYSKDEDVIAAAFLHDVIEDCGISMDFLEKEFNGRIAGMVDEVSLLGKYKNWKEKKEAYLLKIKQASVEALIIVGVDKMNNMQAYFEFKKNRTQEVSSFFGGTHEEYRWYYKTVADILKSKLGEHPIVKDYTRFMNSFFNAGL